MPRKRKKKKNGEEGVDQNDEQVNEGPQEPVMARPSTGDVDELEQAIIEQETTPSPPRDESSDELFSESRPYHERPSPVRRFLPALLGIIVAIILLGVGLSIFVASQLLSAKGEAARVRTSFLSVQDSVSDLDFRAALSEFPKGQESIQSLIKRVDRFSFLSWVPFVGPRITETQKSLHVLERYFTAGERLLDIVDDIGNAIFTRGDTSFELYMRTLTKDDKGRILEAVTQALPTIQGMQAQVALAQNEQNQIRTELLSSDLVSALSQARAGGSYLQSVIETWLPLAEVLPSFLGYPDEKTYLILLQDTSEVRATGGFITHYGILKLHNGEITELRTDNVYNLDDRARDAVSVPPPTPFAKHFPRPLTQWFLRDSNWASDFSESARQAELFYRLEGGHGELDGVIASTPELARTLLRFTGPIRVEGREYTAENLMQQLEFEVAEGQYRRGIEEGKRKELFGELVMHIGEKLVELPFTRWLELYAALETRLNEKHVMIYAHDQRIQDFVREYNWSGEIRPFDGDYLMIVDTTFATLKTESVMDKRIRYTMREDPDKFLVSRLDLTYTNRGTATDVTTVYRDWLRIYVPEGSTLIAAEGFDVPLELSQKYDKLEFAGYLAVEPRHTKTVSIEYRLPERIYQQVVQGDYTLLTQKQPGISNQRFEGNVTFERSIESYQPLGFFNVRRANNTIDFLHDYRTDQEFEVKLKTKQEEK
ncbi:MAG: DUF4012 domain-containing protein [Patescibacteria group bacterium]